MIKLERTEVMGWEHAIRGMRNPLESWAKSDSYEDWWEDPSPINPCDGVRFFVGPNDLSLMMRLRNAGSDERKFMRQIAVYVDITAPLYWWKEFDTYKVGTVANSCSTMHKIHSKEFVLDDFSHEHLIGEAMRDLKHDIERLNVYRDRFNETKDKTWWWQMIQRLPSSYNQMRTVSLNYEVLTNMYHARKAHKLDEWRELCRWIEGLPYPQLITGES